MHRASSEVPAHSPIGRTRRTGTLLGSYCTAKFACCWHALIRAAMVATLSCLVLIIPIRVVGQGAL
jgi:hypothetical protein